MGKSLQDQFLKLGLAQKKQVNKIKKKKHQQKKQAVQDSDVEKSKVQAKKAQESKKDYNKLLNQQKAEQQKQKEQNQQVDQLIETHMLQETAGNEVYKFTAENKIRKLYTSTEIINQLSSGKLAIVAYKKEYKLVHAEIGRKIVSILQDRLILLHEKSTTEQDGDDPYAEYQIPDDLVW